MKKDDYLMTMMQVDPKQRMVIEPFDARTQERSFAVSADGLKGVRKERPVIWFCSYHFRPPVEYWCFGGRVGASEGGQEETGALPALTLAALGHTF